MYKLLTNPYDHWVRRSVLYMCEHPRDHITVYHFFTAHWAHIALWSWYKARFTRSIFIGETAANCRRVFFALISRPIWNKLCNLHVGKTATNLLRSSNYKERHQGLILSSKDFSPVKYEQKEVRYFSVYTSRNLPAPRALFVRLLPPVLMEEFSFKVFKFLPKSSLVTFGVFNI